MNKPHGRVSKHGQAWLQTAALCNRKAIFEQHPDCSYRTGVIAMPSLFGKLLLPLRKTTGHPGDAERVRAGLDLRSRKAAL